MLRLNTKPLENSLGELTRLAYATDAQLYWPKFASLISLFA